MSIVLITGGSGMIGTRLTTLLRQRGYEVRHLERSIKKSPVRTYLWDVDKGTIDVEALQGVKTIIHLAGANIGAKRWTEKRKQEIIDSRVKSTKLLKHALANNSHQVKTFLCASAMGYYGGDCGEEIKGEGDSPGSDFLAKVTQLWEEAATEFAQLGIRVVRIRTGIVLSSTGGALEPMAKQVKYGLAAPLGNGRQYMSWVHIDDHCEAFIHALEQDDMHGPYNSAAPAPATNRQFTQTLARLLQKPMFMPNVPAFILRLALGEMSTLVLGSCRISSDKLKATGFVFKYPDLEGALKNLLKG